MACCCGAATTTLGVGVLLLVAGALAASTTHERVLMRDVTALTLRRGAMTTGRRSSPVSQLSFVGGAAGSAFEPDTVQCVQTGWDGHDAQWRCEASLDDNVRMGSVDVSCEGYEYADDEYITRGSCGATVQLEYSALHGERVARERRDGYYHDSHHATHGGSRVRGSGEMGWSGLLLLAVFVYAIYQCFLKPSPAHGAPAASASGGGGGGGGGGGTGYGGPHPPQTPPHYYQTAPPPSSGGGGPGFWSGLGLGSMVGSWWSRPRYGYGYGGGSGYYNSGWGGGWGGGSRMRWGGGGGGGGGYRSSSSSGGGGGGATSRSGNTRTAAGFGSTSRR